MANLPLPILLLQRPTGFLSTVAGLLVVASLGPGIAVGGAADEPDPDRFEVMVLARALDRPMELTVAPDGRVLWIELGGRLRIHRPDTGLVVEAGTLEVFAEQENGLLGLALDPGFERNNQLYLLYSPPSFSGQRLSRFTLVGDRRAARSRGGLSEP